MRLADSLGFGMCSLPIMALLAFSQVGMTTAIADETAPIGQQPPQMPHFKSVATPYYPDEAKRRGIEGTVLVEFNIDVKGKAKDLIVLRSDQELFTKFAKDFYSSARFDVPGDWASSGNAVYRFKFGMVFCLPPSSQPDAFPESPYPPIYVKGSSLRGAPTRHPVQPGSTSKCAQP
jgi:TonB family protein